MLSLFPSLLAWSELSPFLIRLTLGSIFLYGACKGFRAKPIRNEQKGILLIEATVGALMIIGLWLQAAALVAIINLVFRLAAKIQKKQLFTDGVNYYFLMLIMAISLLITGAGFFAFDIAL